MMHRAYKLGSLFDGSGGFPLAGSLCGVEPVWASEVEPYPIAVTSSRFPNMRHLGDISKVNGGEIEPVDIITFGSPCQDLSVAGKCAGLKHEANGDDETTRSGLFMEAVRIIKEMREATNGEYPTFALWENVPGAFSSNKGEDFRLVCDELIKIVEPSAVMPAVPKSGWAYADSYCGDGWSLAYRVFDAQYWGVPQRRRRIHLVLDLRGERAREVLFEREGVHGYFAEGRTPWKGTAGDAESGAGADDNGGNYVIAIDQQGGKGGANYAENVMPTLCSDSHGTQHAVAYTLKIRSGCDGGGKGALIQENKSATLATKNDQYPFQPIPIHDKATRYKGGGPTRNGDGAWNGLGVGKSGDPCPTLSTCDHHMVCYCMATGQANAEILEDKAPCLNCNHEQPIACYGETKFGKYDETETSPTLRSSGATCAGCSETLVYGVDCRNSTEYPEQTGTLQADCFRNLNSNGVVRVRYIVRRLTPTECARLQGFPDNWGHPDRKEDFTGEEYRFWLDVRNTNAAINGKPQKDYTKVQMLTWYNKLHTDSAEYKMWGNGIALPPALYCMHGIVDALGREEEDD